MDELQKASKIAISGMKAQSERLRVISENLANADSLARTPDGTPYKRKVVTFKSELDRANGYTGVKVDKVRPDASEFQRRYDPKHPAADRDGYVLAPNVNPLIEMMDMREAQRSYEANMNVINSSRQLLSRTVEMLRP
ncbi:flagellar basal body rod protein FlgC [Magnetospirillum gryphiswaldense]|uniref:Flagellar basal-body rod protein FlgC n=1 Tax=Magnetospirillum gryphiswaldense TaxID=55518 RepID=A4U375_9PROT|nr:flagellar basal body rod protein FlgC [Magnetospirillum gryphiswaldense]KAF0224952.1 MAG: flagellar basal-body rod protein [Rhodospirillaceae bacterium]TNC94481.1 MAG: flagellar basal-body rod protein FlgC [Stygiobacter sp.]AVM75852.1 Flagellar basal-body rod protein FlgC [Magnetospirillum gryphiswaldense MSR-1]AVM79755.1 Flagellar basal-body rod protein FlgC [Magnetospirillum gryphiswaldense]CAM77332.1 Flagellar basal-body rod protein FlgC [Magnetospirillum gryphiswaldense MSR-1]